MGGFPVICVLGEAIHKLVDVVLPPTKDIIFMITLLGSLAIVLPAYILARAYLAVECFINLSHLPAGVCNVPRWAAYFLHIS